MEHLVGCQRLVLPAERVSSHSDLTLSVRICRTGRFAIAWERKSIIVSELGATFLFLFISLVSFYLRVFTAF